MRFFAKQNRSYFRKNLTTLCFKAKKGPDVNQALSFGVSNNYQLSVISSSSWFSMS